MLNTFFKSLAFSFVVLCVLNTSLFLTQSTSSTFSSQSQKTLFEELPDVNLKGEDSDAILVTLLNLLQPPIEESVKQKDLSIQSTEARKPVDKTLMPNYQFFDDERQIGLLGIFIEQKRFAVIELITFESGSKEYFKLELGQELMGYKLIKINLSSVELKNAAKSFKLELFSEYK